MDNHNVLVKIASSMALSVLCVFADTLTITGTVKDSAGTPVEGAIVRVMSGGGGGGMARDTTNASGAYSLTINNNTAANITVIASSGARTATATGTVAAPNDGTADAITVNITLGSPQPQTGDTVVVSGTVKDSAGAPQANVVVTVRLGNVGGAAVRDTTDATGAYSVIRVNTNAATSVTASVTVSGRTTSATGTIANPDDGTTDRVTINLTVGGSQPQTGDTVVVSGTVKDSTGATLANAVVTLRFSAMGGGMTTAVDTTDASGNYSITAVNTGRSNTVVVSSRVNNVTGSVTFTIGAPADGTTDRFTANIVIGERVTSVRMNPRVHSGTAASSVRTMYLLNGRQVNTLAVSGKLPISHTAGIVRFNDNRRIKMVLNNK